MIEKRCPKCKTSKPSTEFYTGGTARKSLDGLGGWCKHCRKLGERLRRLDPDHVREVHDKYETDMRFRSRELLRAIAKRSRSSGVPFDLDIDWLAARLSAGMCELTALKFDFSVRSRRYNPFTPSVDRIVPSRGYTKDNCRVVAMAVNVALSNWGVDVLMTIAEALVERRRNKVAA